MSYASNTRNVLIQPITGDYLLRIVEIQEATNLSTWKLEDYQQEIQRKDSVNFMAVINRKAVGFIFMRLINPSEAEIYNLAVQSGFRRQYLGNQLLQAAIKKAISQQNTKDIWLEVRESNLAAISFYIKNGFSIIGRRKNFYVRPVEDAILMRCKIAGEKFSII